MFEPREVARYRRQLAAMLSSAAGAPVMGGTVPSSDAYGGGDPEAFAQVVALLDEARAALVDVATALREPQGPAGGYSWAELAQALGITKSTAWERFSPGPVRRRPHVSIAGMVELPLPEPSAP